MGIVEKQNKHGIFEKTCGDELEIYDKGQGEHEIGEEELELVEEYLNTVDRYLTVLNTDREIKRSLGGENPEKWQIDYQNELKAEIPKLQFKIATIANELDIQFTFNELELLENKLTQLKEDLDKEINIDIKHKLSIEMAGIVDRINSLK